MLRAGGGPEEAQKRHKKPLSRCVAALLASRLTQRSGGGGESKGLKDGTRKPRAQTNEISSHITYMQALEV